MNGKEWFDYLEGKWLITREIVNKLSPLSNASAKGRVSFTKSNKNILNYNELLEVTWKNGNVTNAKKEYDYIIDHMEHLAIYDRFLKKISFMFNIESDQGQYQCSEDTYKATYKFIDNNNFILLFNVTGPSKNYSATSYFIRKNNYNLSKIV